MIWVFVILQFVSLSRRAVMHLFGDQWNVIGYASNVGSIPVFLIILWMIRNVDRPGLFSSLSKTITLWWWSLVLLVFGMVFYGLFARYHLKFIAHDAVPYLYLLGMILVGSKPSLFHFVVNVLSWMLVVAIPLNLYALTDLRSLAMETIEGGRYGVASVSYDTQITLAAWPLLLLLSDRFNRGRATMIYAAVFLFAAMQILFQKRLGTGMVLIAIGLFCWKLLHPAPQDKGTSQKRIREFALVAMVAVVVAVTFGQNIMIENILSLVARFRGAGSIGETGYSRGLWSIFTLENERIAIISDCFRSFAWWEWIFGRGMGGAFEWTNFNMNALQSERGAMLISQYFLDDVGYFGRREFEIGFLMPMLKGGLVLFCAFWGPIIWLVSRVSLPRQDHYTGASYYALVFFCLFLLQGGGFILSDSYALVVMGLVIGRCFGGVLYQPARSGT